MAEEAKKTRKAAQPTSPPSPATPGAEDLSQQVAALAAMVASLQGQLASLATAPPAPVAEEDETELDDEAADQGAAALLTLLDNTLEAEPEPPAPALPADDGFRPYDPDEFARECAEALANPEPLDWSLLAHDAAEDEEDEGLFEPEPPEGDLIAQMVHKHRPMVQGIVGYNDRHPPDFIIEDPLWVHLQANPLPATPEVPSGEAPFSTPASALFDMSLLDDLVEEAAQSSPAQAEADPLEGWDIAGAFAAAASGQPLPPEEEPLPLDPGESPDPEALALVPPVSAIRALALPWRIEDDSLVCLVAKPFDEEALAALEEEAGMPIIRKAHPLTRVVAGLREAYSQSLEVQAREALLFGAAPMPPGPLDRFLGWIGLGRAA